MKVQSSTVKDTHVTRAASDSYLHQRNQADINRLVAAGLTASQLPRKLTLADSLARLQS